MNSYVQYDKNGTVLVPGDEVCIKGFITEYTVADPGPSVVFLTSKHGNGTLCSASSDVEKIVPVLDKVGHRISVGDKVYHVVKLSSGIVTQIEPNGLEVTLHVNSRYWYASNVVVLSKED